MQGTVMMLMALSGLGCHNKGGDVAYAAPTYSGYSSGCYANVYPSYVSPQSFNGCYAGGYSGCYATMYDGGCFGGGCYGGGLSSCYAGCYGGGHHGCGLLARLFSHCRLQPATGYCYSLATVPTMGGRLSIRVAYRRLLWLRFLPVFAGDLWVRTSVRLRCRRTWRISDGLPGWHDWNAVRSSASGPGDTRTERSCGKPSSSDPGPVDAASASPSGCSR